MSEDIDGRVRRVDPDRWLSSRFVAEPQARADLMVLYAFDHELARAGRVARDPLLAEVRRTWWREVLEEIGSDRPVRRQPLAHALADVAARRRLPLEPLKAAVDAWIDEDQVAAAGAIAEAVALTLDPAADREAARTAGRAWRAGVDAAARTAAQRLSAEAFPAVAHAVLAGQPHGQLSRYIRLAWAVARGRL